MSNLDPAPDETPCGGDAPETGTQLVASREVPLGGPRAVTVRRTLPHRDRSTVGAWCFLDEYGPVDLGAGATGVHVPPHPHTGLQTVTWLLQGEVRHRDGLGSDVLVRPGELNLMTSGRGIAHSEHTPDAPSPVLRGVQLWVALPEAVRDGGPAFAQHADLPTVELGGARARVFVGELAGARSPAVVHTPLLGAELVLAAGARLVLALEEGFEHGLLVLEGAARVAGTELPAGPLLFLGAGRGEVELAADGPCTLLLLGGAPFEEDLVMWWNFVGRDHDEIAAARADWERGRRFAEVPGGEQCLPAPALPRVRLRPRRR